MNGIPLEILPQFRTSYNIEVQDSDIIVCQYSNIPRVLNFKSRKIAEQFAEQFKDLIETAKELL